MLTHERGCLASFQSKIMLGKKQILKVVLNSENYHKNIFNEKKETMDKSKRTVEYVHTSIIK